MLAMKQLFPIHFHSIYFPTMEVNGDQQLFGSSKLFKISSFVFNIKKRLIQVWNDMRVSKWWQNFHFWVNYSFKVSLSTLTSVVLDHIYGQKAFFKISREPYILGELPF